MFMDGRFQAVRATGENLQIRTLFFLKILKKTFFIALILGLFDDLVESTLLAGGKSKKKRKKDGYLGDPARGQADPGSAAVYTTDWPGPVICMYVCVGTCPTHSDPHIHLLWPLRVYRSRPRCVTHTAVCTKFSTCSSCTRSRVLFVYYTVQLYCSTTAVLNLVHAAVYSDCTR
jgi:hypothetical protein